MHSTEEVKSHEVLRELEKQFAAAQRLAHVATWRWNLLDDSLHWSEEHYRICGISPDQSSPTGQKMLPFIHPDDRDAVDQALQAAKEGAPFDCEARLIRPDGTIRHIHSRGELVRDAAGRAVEIVGIVQDVTDWKLAQERLEASEQRFRRMAENIREVFWLKDALTGEVRHRQALVSGGGVPPLTCSSQEL